MVPSISRLVAALAALCYCGLAVAQRYTYQTAPASDEYLEADKPLVVRWEMRPGNSPDSPNVATPPTLTVSLGFRKGETAVVLYPPIGQVTGDISVGSWTWQKMDFSGFLNGPPPPRDTTTEWFIRLGDQNTGYVSNGQLFKILEVTPGTATASTTNPAAPTAPTAPGTVPPTTSNTPASTAAPAAAPSTATSAAPTIKTSPTATGLVESPTSKPQFQSAASALGATCVALFVPAALIVSLF